MTKILDHLRNMIQAKEDKRDGRANTEKVSGECEALFKTDPTAAEDKIRNLPPATLFALANQDLDSNSSPEKLAATKFAKEYFAKQYGDALQSQVGGDRLKALADKLASLPPGEHLSRGEWADLEVASQHLRFIPPTVPDGTTPSTDNTIS